jgi:hypothetical protein
MATKFGTSTITGSFTAQGSQKEDLANYISNISRDMTPFMSSIGKNKASAITHEWSTDTLAAAALQAAVEGSSFAESAGPVVQKIDNKAQIFTKGIRVSGSLEAVDKAGRKSEFKYQTEKRGKEIMRDIEKTLVSSQTKGTQGSSASGGIQAYARKMGGYQSYAGVAESVASVTSGSLTVTQAAGDGSDVASSSGTGKASEPFTLASINEILREINGETSAAPSKVMMSTANKVNFSNLVNTSSMNTRRNIDEKGKLRQSVDLYESDFGDVELVHNYLMDDTEVFVYDPSLLSVATLRPIQFRDINEDGDSLRSYMVHECTLEAKSPSGNGVIIDVSLT